MLIITDAHIPFLVEAVRCEWPEVDICPLKPEQIDPEAVRQADVLVVRTRTQVNKSLLSGSQVRLVCTATIGFDHIDTEFCDRQGIRWISCPGCNAQAVCDYVEEAIEEIKNEKLKIKNSSLTLGVVGVGHVGSLVAQMAERKGLKVLLNDPPKGIGVSLDEIAQNSDIITFHTRSCSNANRGHSLSTLPVEASSMSRLCSVAGILIYWTLGRTSRTSTLRCWPKPNWLRCILPATV